MTFTRGYVWAEYVDDTGTTWSLRVDADYAADTSRGWTTPPSAAFPPFPRGWHARYVEGLDPEGHPRRALIGSVAATLWTGAVQTFDVQASDLTVVTCDRIRQVQELRRPRPPA